jgi:hypothetical protein
MYNATTLDEEGLWDVLRDELDEQLNVDELVEWMIEAEKEVCREHGDDKRFGHINAAVRHYIDDRIHEDTKEYVDTNIDVAAFARLFTELDEDELRSRLYDTVETDVRHGIESQL